MAHSTNETPEITQPQGLPRREFIRKSLIASGGTFAGMALGNQFDMAAVNRFANRDSSASKQTSSRNRKDLQRRFRDRRPYNVKTGGHS